MGKLDPLRARLKPGEPPSRLDPEIASLAASDVRGLRLPWLSRFSYETLAEHIKANPRKAVWVPATGEYIIAERWRHRDDIGNIVEVTARKGREALVRALLGQMRSDGCRLALLSDEAWSDQSQFYADRGFSMLERIVFFQRSLKDNAHIEVAGALPALDYRIAEYDELDLLIKLDNNSFPWLWWNSREDMALYLTMDGVSVYIARERVPGGGGDPVGYASFTMYDGWAHLDRLAVVTPFQGHRYGAAQLVHAMESMLGLGASYVGLSTQENNVQSHRLYKGFGFRQTRDFMSIYGVWLHG